MGGSFITITFPGLVESLEAIVQAAPALAQEMLTEEVRVAVSILRGKASDPTFYGVQETINALEEGVADPVEIESDPARGIYRYGAGRIAWTTEAGSAPPDSIKTFLTYYRAQHPEHGSRRSASRVTVRTPRMRAARPPKMSRADQRAVRTALRDLEVGRINQRSAPQIGEIARLERRLYRETSPAHLATIRDRLAVLHKEVNTQARQSAAERFILQKPLPREVIVSLLKMNPASARRTEVAYVNRVTFTGRGRARYATRDESLPPLRVHRLTGGLGRAVGAAYRAEAKRLGGAEHLVFQRSRHGPGPAGRPRARVQEVAKQRLSKNSTLMRSLAALPGARVQELLRLTPTTGEGYIYGGGKNGSARFGLRRYQSVRVTSERAKTKVAQVRHIASGEKISLARRATTSRPDMRPRGRHVGRDSAGMVVRSASFQGIGTAHVRRVAGKVRLPSQKVAVSSKRVAVPTKKIAASRGFPVETRFDHGVPIRLSVSMAGSKHLGRIPLRITTNVELTKTILVVKTYLTDHYHDRQTALHKISAIIHSPALKGGHDKIIDNIYHETAPHMVKGSGLGAVRAIERDLSKAELKAGEFLLSEMHRQLMQLPSASPSVRKEP